MKTKSHSGFFSALVLALCLLSILIIKPESQGMQSLIQLLNRPFTAEQAHMLLGECSVMLVDQDQRDKLTPFRYALSLDPNFMLGQQFMTLAAMEYHAEKLEEEVPMIAVSRGSRQEAERSSIQESLHTQRELATPALAPGERALIPVPAAAFSRMSILSYCTHSSESYIPDSGLAREEGKLGLINTVADTMMKRLRQHGFAASHDSTLHDWPSYNDSYTNSDRTVQRLIENNENIVALFDIHRDSIPGATTGSAVTISGKKAAQILIIVGGNGRRSHPNWEENQDFAEALYQFGTERYPGLIRGVRTYEASYHQQYHEHALLLEMGSDRNTLAESVYAAELFADLLAAYLQVSG